MSHEASETESPKPSSRQYTQRLIRRKYIPLDEIDDNFNEQEWMKKLYGEDVRIVNSVDEVPERWILIEGRPLPLTYVLTTLRSSPAAQEDRKTTMESTGWGRSQLEGE